ncbi:MurR/RpiR family transcriptional regulator [Neoaquamicrobium sediminum]|uniref:MurR/RpiR family transcriptional regulator n=1 Tax=Neoaquamicrobium sediminum TaxID=1849104 RepID=UPI0015666DFD|nr:MurR/RpiR family transcriptional regulator [Mesorhizobium sediminum]NRC53793.1 MurR/RpiR family transcriptional regulator [Mesorhizobium sediminum]
MNDRSPAGEAAYPRDYETLRETILEQRSVLPKRIAQVAAYALDNPDEIAFGTTASIAASAGVQPSTLIRFAQQLGFDGFTSLQSVFRERLRERNTTYEERLAALRDEAQNGTTNRAMLDGFLAASVRSLDLMARSVDEATLDRAVGILARAETLYILAKRRSFPVASYLGYALGKLHVRSQIIESASGLQPEMIGFATPRDAVIAVSFSPYAPATIDEVRVLHERGVPIVAITDSAFSPLAQFAAVWFEVAESDFSGFRSLGATMALAMTLAVGCAEERRRLAG